MIFYDLVNKIDEVLVDNNHVLTYAFNAIGKTRISQALIEKRETEEGFIRTLCYNAFLEDGFTWDNESGIFKVEDSWLVDFIKVQGIENRIVDVFRETIGKNIEPRIDFYSEEKNIVFITANGNDSSYNIKISKGEETIFKWALFYAVLKEAVMILKVKDDRQTDLFDNLELVIIDDPVSSIDDYRIFAISCQIIELLNEIREHNKKFPDNVINISFLISTHHTLFFNILFYKLGKTKSGAKNYKYFIELEDSEYKLTEQDDDSVISYHGSVIKEIKRAIESNSIERYHFNLFRNVAEKTCAFLGYKHWQDLFKKYNRLTELDRVLNSNSHTRYPEIEAKVLQEEQERIFKDGFDWFLREYRFSF